MYTKIILFIQNNKIDSNDNINILASFFCRDPSRVTTQDITKILKIHYLSTIAYDLDL